MDVKLFLPVGLQIVLPERRDVPQSLNDGREMLDDVIHFLLSIINGKAETDGPMGGRKRDTHGPENVRRFEGARRTGRP